MSESVIREAIDFSFENYDDGLFGYLLLNYLLKNNYNEYIDELINRVPELLKYVDSYGLNIMHEVCHLCNYDTYIKFVNLCPELMNKCSSRGVYPIEMLFQFRQIKKNPSCIKHIDNINKITEHYLENYVCDCKKVYVDLLTISLNNENIIRIIDIIKDDVKNLTIGLSYIFQRIVSKGEIGLLKLFFKNGADPNLDISEYCHQRNITELACCAGNLEIFKIVEKNGGAPIVGYLKHMIDKTHFKLFKYIQDKYLFDLNIKINNEPFIHYVCAVEINNDLGTIMRFRNKIIPYLIKNCDLNLRVLDRNNRTLLHNLYVSYMSHEIIHSLIPFLIDCGIDIYHRDDSGYMFYHLKQIDHNDVYFLDELGLNLSYHSLDSKKINLFCVLLDYDSIFWSEEEYCKIIDIIVYKHEIKPYEYLLNILKTNIQEFVINYGSSGYDSTSSYDFEDDDSGTDDFKDDDSDTDDSDLQKNHYIRIIHTLQDNFYFDLSDMLDQLTNC